MLKYLRIAVTALSLMACVLLIALWVRSYFRLDQFIWRVSTVDYFAVTSGNGRILLGRSDDPNLKMAFKTEWSRRHVSMSIVYEPNTISFFPATVGMQREIFPRLRFEQDFYYQSGNQIGTSYEVALPYWLLIAPFATLIAAPWIKLLLGLIVPTTAWVARIKWRFSLRTLLIATTLVAVALGIIMAAQ